jgi:hypothetical protein
MNLDSIEKQFSVRDEHGHRWIAPCFTIAYTFSASRAADEIRELVEAVIALVGARFTILLAKSNERPVPWDATSLRRTMETWLERPRPGKHYSLLASEHRSEAPEAQLVADLALAPSKPKRLTRAEIRMAESLIASGAYTKEQAAEMEEGIRRIRAGIAPEARLRDSLVYVCIPLSTFSAPTALRQWMMQRSLSALPDLVSAHGGIGLSEGHYPNEETFVAVSRRLSGMLLRYPTLAWERTYVDWHRARGVSAEPESNDPTSANDTDEHYVVKARWLNLISSKLVDVVGGPAALRSAAEVRADVSLERIGPNVLVTAGASPEPEEGGNDGLLGALRYVNRLLAPARIRRFDGPYGAPKDFSASYLSLGESDAAT